jgi:hypothetical protein
MMKAYKPSDPFDTPLYLLIPTTTTVKGSTKKVYPKPSSECVIFASFKTYGGTESQSNGVTVVEDTANIETWYRPDIQSDCRIALGNNPAVVYEVIGEPENINMRNQYLKFKIRRIKGGA